MSHHHEDKKSKKKNQLKKNRKLQEIFHVMRLQRDEAERVEKHADALEKPDQPTSKDEVADKMATIRNRLTNQKRHSRERWNRFAGTSGGGGRGL